MICCRFNIHIARHSWILFLLFERSLMMCANNQIHYGPMVRLFARYTTSLSSLFRRIWRYLLSSVCLRIRLSQLWRSSRYSRLPHSRASSLMEQDKTHPRLAICQCWSERIWKITFKIPLLNNFHLISML